MITSLSNRKSFPCLETHSYLNQASLGLIGSEAVSAMHEFLDTTARHGNLRMSDTEEADFLNPLRSQIAQLINAQTENIAIISSSSEMLSQLPELIAPAVRNKIILVSNDFPAITRPWISYSKRKDLNLCFVDEKDTETLTDQIIKNIDKDTAAVCISFVQFSSGTCLNIPQLRKATNNFDVKLIVDITQAAGAIPLYTTDWCADVVVCSGYKWLGGHGGIAFAVLSDELLKKTPPWVGWFGGEDPFNMNAKQLSLSKTATKYTQSTLSYISAVGLSAALKELLEIDVNEINAHSYKLAGILLSGLEHLEWKPFRRVDSSEFSGHIISLNATTLNIPSTQKYLIKNGIICGIRNGRIRISLAHYNNERDVQSLLKSLKDLTH
ncbi:MAG: aminotransferase class V-fold PLP-dependent enzyme [Paracoccaceae bacterium]|nr:aminotransferase class V-fold PLP-dependent enzyme [Paracoccaceae bacterium]